MERLRKFETADLSEMIKAARKRLLKLHCDSRTGHIGGNLSCIDALIVLFRLFITENDRFLLSKGHSAGALYTALHSVGVISEDELLTFGRDGSRLGIHPPVNAFPEIPFATGSLGHGLSLCAGMALGRRLEKKPGIVYCLVSDGELEEGSCHEALQFIAHHRLDNLRILVDINGWQGFDTTEDAAGWNIDRIRGLFENSGLSTVTADGHAPEAICAALSGGKSAILLKTVKGKGVPCFENTLRSHYLPLDERQYKEALEELQ